jgi:hypothetical protein
MSSRAPAQKLGLAAAQAGNFQGRARRAHSCGLREDIQLQRVVRVLRVFAASHPGCGSFANAASAAHRQRSRPGSSDGVLMLRAICCDAQRDARNAVARARRSKSQDGADCKAQYVGGHPSHRVRPG